MNKIYICKDMDELSDKDKDDSQYSEGRKTLIKTLLKFRFQNNFICFTLTNLLPVNGKFKRRR